MRAHRIVVVLVVALALALGACSDEVPAKKSASRDAASSPAEPVNPRRTPAELLLEVAAGYVDPTSISFKGTVSIGGDVAPVVRFNGGLDPNAGQLSGFLIVARAAGRRPIVTKTLIAEGDDYLRAPGLPTRPGRPWLRVPDRSYPAGLRDDWEVLSDITDPARHLKLLAAEGDGLRRRIVQTEKSTYNRVDGTLAGTDVPTSMCAGLDLRPRSVKATVWVFGISVDRLIFRCSFPGKPDLTIRGSYTGEDRYELSLLAPKPRNVTEIPGLGAETVGV